ncbi:hypothetical protein O3M35_002095 [Rhynocoris fuscipes]|uniref:Uncharacterized protein n=1 Tax=Rhynocoris fuscipes TaxID=488301 RepID=A0AAW1CT43_9HEMI
MATTASPPINKTTERPKDESFFNRLYVRIKPYFESTTLHGLKYLAESNRPKYERTYWIIALIAAYISVTWVIFDQIEYFFRNPVLISISPNPKTVSDIPFPAVTICPDSQILKDTYNLQWATMNTNNVSVNQNDTFNFAMLVCHLQDLSQTDVFLKYLNTKFVHNMLDMINGEVNCNHLMPAMVWGGEILYFPCRYIQPTVTFFGACLTFNMLPYDDIYRFPNVTLASYWSDKYNSGKEKSNWNPETGFIEKPEPTHLNMETKPTPWIIGKSGLLGTSSFYLSIPIDHLDDTCSTGGTGFVTIIHNPAEVPGSSHPIEYIESDYLLHITLSPIQHEIDKRLIRWAPQERGCYFQHERYLQYFKIYTQRNCEMECEANITELLCNCRAHYHPRTQDIPVCGPALFSCTEFRVGQVWNRIPCDCLPSCSELYYRTSSSKFNRDWSKHIINFKIPEKRHYSAIVIKYQDRNIDGLRRDIMVSFTDFIANIGGILGLFLGFSCISVFEIIYFVAIRYYTKRRRGQ